MVDKTTRITAAAFRELPASKRGRKAAVEVPPAIWTEQDALECDLLPPLPLGDKFRHYETGILARPASYSFTYIGVMVSANATFAGMHWTKRKALTEKWHGIFAKLLTEAGTRPMARFKLLLRYNSRHDCDNLVLPCKWLADTIKGRYVPDDSKKYYRGVTIEPDETLKHNTFTFTITEQP